MGVDFESGREPLAKEEAARMAEGQILDAIEENLPEEAEQAEWNWDALAKVANTRWKLNLRDRDLKKVGRDNVGELLQWERPARPRSKSHRSVAKRARVLEDWFTGKGRSACGLGALRKFNVQLSIPRDQVKSISTPRAVHGTGAANVPGQAYDEKEADSRCVPA